MFAVLYARFYMSSIGSITDFVCRESPTVCAKSDAHDGHTIARSTDLIHINFRGISAPPFRQQAIE
jgi:hypothetical protein